jgi:hypothetical protein
MSKPSEGAKRRDDFLDRLQQAGDRHEAAEQELQDARNERATGAEMRHLRDVIDELRAAAEDTRRMNAEIRQEFFELIQDLRRAAGGT